MKKREQLYHHAKECWNNIKHPCTKKDEVDQHQGIKKWWHNLSHFCRHALCNLLVGLIITLSLIPFHHTDTYRWLEDISIDWVIKMLRANPPTDQTTPSFVILDIDEATYRHWDKPLITPRDNLLQLIKIATEKQAKIVMVDIDLSDLTDRSQPLDHPNNQADKALYEFFKEYQKNCGQNCPYIFLARRSYPSLNPEQPYREQSRSFLDPVVTPERRVYWASTLFDLESDQVLRRWHLWQPTCNGEDGNVLPSMQFLAKAVHHNQIQQELEELAHHKPDCKNLNSLEESHSAEAHLGRRILYRIPWHLESNERLPNMANDRMLLERFSVKTLIEGIAKPSGYSFQEQIVIIGGSYADGRDIHATPLGKMPGIWVLANATHSLLQGELKQYKVLKYLAEGLLIVIMTFAFVCFSSFLGMFLSGMVIIVGMIPLSLQLFGYAVWLDFVFPLLGVQIHYMYERDKELRQKLGELSMCINVKFLIGFILLCLTPLAFAAPAVGRIQDFDGNGAPLELGEGSSKIIVPAAYTLIRDKDKKVDIGFLTELQAGDLLIVNDNKHSLKIRFANASEEVVNAQNSPYVVTAKGEVPTISGNIWAWATQLTRRQQREKVMAVDISTKGGDSEGHDQPPSMALLEPRVGKLPKVLLAGKRALFLTWQQGKPDYQITLKQGDKILFEQTVTERVFQSSELDFKPGEYQVLLSDSEQRSVPYPFTVVDSLPAYPSELTDKNLASLSKSARVTLQALWLANQENEKWLFEAYQRVAEISKDHHFARVLQDALGDGTVLKPSE